ncbi:hypothetical protein SLEP1_g46805 [Rubroshorea leprosula]|uniref:Uncharacterized protein n=1 Tax=Rubroshorea leprosula TaxID=152421 RepID=A0AAV5LQ90_9ROSI|nr:hypothetical protein SLEP1_g46805 [Rubroshorea leprosula]
MLEPACAPSSDDPSRSGDPWLFPVDLGRGSLGFSFFVLFGADPAAFFSPLADLRRRVRGLPDLTPTAALCWFQGSSAAGSGDRTASWSLVLFLQG